MKKFSFKKMLSVMLSLFFVFSAMSTGSIVSHAAEPMFNVVGDFDRDNKTVEIKVSVENAKGFTAGTFEIKFDPSAISHEDSTKTPDKMEDFDGGFAINIKSDGTVRINYIMLKPYEGNSLLIFDGFFNTESTNSTKITVSTIKSEFDDKTKNVATLTSEVDLEHRVENWTTVTKATCSKPGTKQGKCVLCGETVTVETPINPNNHSYKWSTVSKSTCTKQGSEKGVCIYCGAVTTNTLALNPDNHVNFRLKNERDATCTNGGYSGDKYCTDCGKFISKGAVTKKLGHDFTNKNNKVYGKQPTCTASGYYQIKCNHDGCEVLNPTKVTIKALGHNYVNGKCTRCKAVEPSKVTVMLGDVDNDGKILAKDARIALRVSARLDPCTDYILAVADFNRDGIILSPEARKILRVSARLERF